MSHSSTGKHFWSSIAAWLVFSIVFAIKPAFGQIYPVQANINITPPYTVFLNHYTSPEQQRVMVNLLLHDPVVSSIDVRFRFILEGGGIRIYTNPGWIPQPYTLTNGISSLIPSDIIAEYFQPQHIIVEGTNPQDFFRKGKLPEGFYQFKVEVLEYQRAAVISNTARAGIWLLLNESPRIVFPIQNQKVKATNPQMLNFTWVPGGISSPLSALSTMYEFTMVEIQGNIDPTIAITTASEAIKFTKTLQQTSLFYGPGEPQLIPGKRYAVRVRAFNTDGYELFKNNGYSEVRVFQFGDACNPPISFNLKDETQSTFNIDVQTDPSNTAWQAQFRELEDESNKWSELNAESETYAKTVKGLKASTTYEIQVKGLCGQFSSDLTLSKTITTKEKTNTQRNCENTVSPFVVKQALPLVQLKKDDIFIAALVPIKVTNVNKQGGGKFTGSGIATLPIFNAGLAVTFDDIGINELMQLTSGEVNVVRNEFNITLFGDELPPTDGAGDGTTTTDSLGDGTWPPFTDTITVNVPFDSIVVVNDSTIWVIPSSGGDAIVVSLGGSSCTLIVPSDGNMNNAQVVYNGAAKPYNSSNGYNATQEQFTGFLANFAPSIAQQYGYDSLRHTAHANYYNEMEVNGKTVKMPWKALAPSQVDPINLKIRRSAETYPYSDLKVSIWGGNELQPTVGANTANQTYNLTGTSEGDEFAVVAKFKADSKDINAGGIWAVTYQPKTFKLYVIPFPGIDVDEQCARLQNELTQIYKQALVSWTVQPLKDFPGIELGENGLDWADKNMLSSYNAEMNSVISAFKAWKENPDPDAYYLFVVPKFSEDGLEGFMPRNRRFGFVKTSQMDARTVAHEIGHGAFNLRHTFPEAPQSSTDNLMDYTQDKYALLKAQWDLIHNPENTTGLWDDMEDGASIFGITWLGNYLWGLAPDEQESQIETDRTLFKYVFDNYDKFFENSKTTNLNLEKEEYQKWSVRKVSHQGISKRVFEGIKESKTSLSLYKEGIYFENYILEDKSYKIAIYSKLESVELNNNIRIESYQSLRYNKFIKVGYTNEYGLIVFYDTNGKMQITLQIIGGNSSKESVIQWVNYLGLILPSEKQTEGDQSILSKMKSIVLHEMTKLIEIWGGGVIETSLENVTWVSQFDESYFEKETCWSEECCNKAASKILEFSGTSTSRSYQVIAAESSNLNCSNISKSNNFETVLQIIDTSLFKHKLPIMIGVHHPKAIKDKGVIISWEDNCSGNTPSITNHYVIVIGKKYDITKKRYYYLFYEVGTSDSDNGKSSENRLYIYNNQIKGKTKNVDKEDYYTITEVRKNIGKNY